ncbi:hypothetical protein QZH41_013832 [Actinostola sp. cb2023]|nr:hypothetical protein QZH41_013832 [Actinostola sp. cb2023]
MRKTLRLREVLERLRMASSVSGIFRTHRQQCRDFHRASKIRDGARCGGEGGGVYFSSSITKSERNYCITRKELLAVIMSGKRFHYYLYSKPFKIRTDHGAWRWLINFKKPENQLARWIELLDTYDFVIEHRRGKSHTNATPMPI